MHGIQFPDPATRQGSMTTDIFAPDACRFFRLFAIRSTAPYCAVLFFWVFFILSGPFAQAQELPPQWRPLVARLAAEGLDQRIVSALFVESSVAYDPEPMARKMEELYAIRFGTKLTRNVQTHLVRLGYLDDDIDGKVGPKTRNAVRLFELVRGMEITGRVNEALLAVLSQETRPMPPGTTLPEEEDRDIVYRTVLTPERLAEARAFYNAHRGTLAEVHRRYGVPPEIAVGIVTVETRCGLYLGEKSAFATLASMAASRDLDILGALIAREQPSAEARRWLLNRMREKADWAQKELVAMFQYAGLNRLDPQHMPGSVYGAIGVCQFMPSNALEFGVDGDGDGVVDLFATEDALMSLGNFLSQHGWKRGGNSIQAQRKALYRYNYSKVYVNTVLAVAERLRGAGTDK
ncbi:peptidoglycan-binding protein [Oceanidesulfovibrio indonesiensis]|uniref:Peptidoglycan-binding protein n=2 Tax=Oceanidesulfovibrio indonesiensis TaxID=54767 RepID=A0A7M3MJP7_9BACT|nr:peptidoglycan-binding protein [Oceanidesulfovibrio indonesiensis]